jgi:hypothetical protein
MRSAPRARHRGAPTRRTLSSSPHPRDPPRVPQLLDSVSVRPAMTTSESFLDYIWQKLGAESREHAREANRLLERLPPEDRPKFLASLTWASWCRGRNDHAAGKDRYWDMD